MSGTGSALKGGRKASQLGALTPLVEVAEAGERKVSVASVMAGVPDAARDSNALLQAIKQRKHTLHGAAVPLSGIEEFAEAKPKPAKRKVRMSAGNQAEEAHAVSSAGSADDASRQTKSTVNASKSYDSDNATPNATLGSFVPDDGDDEVSPRGPSIPRSPSERRRLWLWHHTGEGEEADSDGSCSSGSSSSSSGEKIQRASKACLSKKTLSRKLKKSNASPSAQGVDDLVFAIRSQQLKGPERVELAIEEFAVVRRQALQRGKVLRLQRGGLVLDAPLRGESVAPSAPGGLALRGEGPQSALSTEDLAELGRSVLPHLAASPQPPGSRGGSRGGERRAPATVVEKAMQRKFRELTAPGQRRTLPV